jgi:hypothetical protein
MAREAAYESKFGNRPTPVAKTTEKKEGGFFSNLFSGGLSGIMSGLVSTLVKGGLIVGALAAIGKAIEKFFTDKSFRDSVTKTIVDFFKSDFGKALMIGAGVVVGVFATFRLALLALEAVVLKIAARMAGAFGVPGPGAAGGGKGGKGGKPTPKGAPGSRIGWLTPLLLGLPFLNDMIGDDNGSDTPNIPGATGTPSVPGSTSSTSSQSSSGADKFKIGINAGVAGIAAVDAANRLSSLSTPKVSGFNSAAGRFVDSSGKFVSAKELPKGDMLRKFFDFASKAVSKGWMSRIGGKLAVRLGVAVATKAVAFIAGLAVPGAGWLVSAASLAMLAYDAYTIYDAIFSKNGILEELEKEDAIKASSAQQNETPSIPASATPPSSSPTSVPSQSSTTATSAVTQMGGASGTFNGLTREQQDAFLNAQYAREGNKPGNLAYDLKNPGAMLYSDWQKAYGAVPNNDRGKVFLNGKKVPFAQFPSFEQGREAQRALWSSKYGNMPLSQAVATWSGTKIGTVEHANYTNALMAAANNSGANLNSSSVAMNDGRTSTSSGSPVVNNTQVAQNAPAPKPMEVPDLKVYDSDLAKFLLEPVVI